VSFGEANVDCERCVDAAPYVLGALDEPEPYREHLATCATCQAAVAELQPAVDTLGTTVPRAVASQALRQRVLATVRSEAELLRAAGHQADEPPDSQRRRQAHRGPWLTAGVAIAAGVAVAVAIALNVGGSPSQRVTSGQVANAFPGARASLRQSAGHAELVVSGMPQPPSGRIYEVWLSRGGGSPAPTDALFGVTSRGSGSVNVPGRLGKVKEVLVTSEPLGGSARPTSAPVIRVTLRS
jgi:Anti-sigma-K factor rskA